MTIFVVFRVSDPEKMKTAMQSAFPNNHLQVDTDEWIVSATGTAKDISEKLGVTKGENSTVVGPAMIFSMANYYGRATTEIWDWIKSKLEAPSG